MVVNRSRLFDEIESAMASKALWVNGPPGSGKTTLIASYIESRDIQTLWYQLDSTDTDIASFFYYLRQSALKHSKEATHAIPELPSGADDWVKYGQSLIRAIYTRFNGPLMIIFDNYESIQPHSELHEVFNRVIEQVPSRSLITFISRNAPTSNLARHIANDLVHVIDGKKLKLNKEENQNIARMRKIDMSEEILEKIHESTDGWLTGSILMLEHARQSKQLDNKQFGEYGDVLFDYVANEIFSGFDDTAKKFLLDVCWPRRLTLGLAEELSGEPTTRQILTNLARNNYFVSERDDSVDREYILHPMIREFLQQKSRDDLSNKALTDLFRKTANMLVNEGQPEEAVELLAANMDWEPLEEVVAQHAPLLLEQGRYELLASWIEEIPEDRLSNNPWLIFWYGKARQQQAPREARNYFDRAFTVFKSTTDDSLGKILCLSGGIEMVLKEMDDFSLLGALLTEQLDILTDDDSLPENPYSNSVYVLVLIAMLIRRPETDNLQWWIERAEQSSKNLAYSTERYTVCFWLVMAYSLRGDLDKAANTLGSLLDICTHINKPELSCQYHIVAALLYVLRGDGKSASKAGLQALDIAEQHGLNKFISFIYACLCSAELTNHNIDEAGTWLEKLVSESDANNRFLRFIVHYLQSWRSHIAGDIINSHHEQKRALNDTVELGMPFLEVLSRTALAQLLYLCDDSRAGNTQLRKVHSIARDVNNPLLEFMTLIAYGEVAMREGRVSSGTNALRFGLGLGRQHAYYHLPWWTPRQLSEVCALALKNNIEIDYVKDFIDKRQLHPVAASMDIPDWPWPFQLRMLGDMEITGTESEVTKTRSRPFELLKLLVAMGGREVEISRVIEEMWPHVDADYGLRSLTINLHRLRRVFGNDESIILKENRLSVNQELIWLDVWTLERQVLHIDELSKNDFQDMSQSALEQLADELLTLYRGSFLMSEDGQSVYNAKRDDLRIEFNRALNALMDTLKVSSADSIHTYYDTCLNHDPINEPIYRRLMQWYVQQGNKEAAIETYERCKSAMAKMPQLEPSTETQTLAETLA
jgi:ATP/maltotriose-dependent transcriptional regulator MalT/DNA-binding SARP family transcriptional activator